MKTLRFLGLAFLLGGCAALEAPVAGEADFASIRDGMTRTETLQLLGRPFETVKFPLSGNESWDYHFQDTWGYMAGFSVIFGPDGTVVGRVTQRLNDGGDHGN